MSKQLITGVLSTLFKMPTETIESVLKDSDLPDTSATDEAILKAITDADKTRVGKLNKTSFQDGFKKAKGEVLTEFENKLREAYSIDADEVLTGEELIKAIAEESQKNAGKSGKGLTEEAIKKSPLYIKLEQDFTKAKADSQKAIDDAVAANEGKHAKEKLTGDVSTESLKLLDGLKPVLSTEKGDKQKGLFVKELLGDYDFERTEDGKDYIVLDKQGKRVEDQHGNAKMLKDIVADVATGMFDFQKAEARNSPNNGGNNNGNSGGNGGGNNGGGGKQLPTPKNQEELTKIVNDTANYTVQERMTVAQTFADANKGA